MIDDGYKPTKHKKKKGKKKPFVLEYKLKDENIKDSNFLFFCFGRNWTTYKRYKTEAQRDAALHDLNYKTDEIFEYRKGNP